MPIENIFIDLTKAITDLTAAFTKISGAAEAEVKTEMKAAKVKEAPKADVQEESEDSQEAEVEAKPTRKPRKAKAELTDSDGKANITSDEVIAYAKIKMAEGHERATIKKKISALGAEAISDLTQENLNKLYDWLQELTVDESL